MECHFCGRRGHMEADCFAKQRAMSEERARAQQRRGGRRGRGGAAHVAFAARIAEPTAPGEHDTGRVRMLADSASSRHIFRDAHLFSSLRRFVAGTAPQIRVANRQSATAVAVGDVPVLVRTATGELLRVVFRDALLVPDFADNLVSTGLIARTSDGKPTGHAFGDGPSGPAIVLQDGRTIPLVVRGPLVELLAEPAEPDTVVHAARTDDASTELTLLHARMGHLNLQDLRKLPDIADGVTLHAKDAAFCDACALGKSARKPVAKAAQPRNTKPGELIHSDMAGPMEVPSLGGKRFAIVFIDDATRWTEVFLTASKTELAACLQEYVAAMASIGAAAPFVIGHGTTLQSDNGGEYRSKSFTALCARLRITQRFCPPHMRGTASRSACGTPPCTWHARCCWPLDCPSHTGVRPSSTPSSSATARQRPHSTATAPFCGCSAASRTSACCASSARAACTGPVSRAARLRLPRLRARRA